VKGEGWQLVQNSGLGSGGVTETQWPRKSKAEQSNVPDSRSRRVCLDGDDEVDLKNRRFHASHAKANANGTRFLTRMAPRRRARGCRTSSCGANLPTKGGEALLPRKKIPRHKRRCKRRFHHPETPKRHPPGWRENSWGRREW